MSWFEQRLSEIKMLMGSIIIGIIYLRMINLLKQMNMVVEFDDDGIPKLQSQIYKYEYFVQKINKKLPHNNDYKDHITIPFLSYITPTMNLSFMLHIMLPMGRFDTEIETTLQINL